VEPLCGFSLWLTFVLAGTNPIHNKQKKKAKKEEDEDDVAYKQKQAAGTFLLPIYGSSWKANTMQRRKLPPISPNS